MIDVNTEKNKHYVSTRTKTAESIRILGVAGGTSLTILRARMHNFLSSATEFEGIFLEDERHVGNWFKLTYTEPKGKPKLIT